MSEFTPAEDDIIIQGINEGCTYPAISKRVTDYNMRTGRPVRRSAESIRQRYNRYLAPTMNMPFTRDEDALLIRLHGTMGSRWKAMTQFFPGRSYISLRNHWNQIGKSARVHPEPLDPARHKTLPADKSNLLTPVAPKNNEEQPGSSNKTFDFSSIFDPFADDNQGFNMDDFNF